MYTPCHWRDFASPISLLFTVPMLPRRHSRAVPNTTPPQPTSGSLSSRRPLNLVTHQHPFRASTTQTVETESFVSEILPQEILPVPLQPVSFPPGDSGHRRQQTRDDAQETLRSPPFEERVSSQPPGVMPMPIPSISRTPEPPSPMQFPQPAPGGGIGGFASTPLPHREPGHGNFCNNAAGYTRLFDPKFSAKSDSNSSPYETTGVSEGVHAGIWPTYNKVCQEFDEKRLKKWNDDLDLLLIFVSLVVQGDRWSLILIGLTRPAVRFVLCYCHGLFHQVPR